MAAARAYLDWNATTPMHPAAKAAVVSALDCLGNPSSVHAEGRAARAMMEQARADVAALVGGEAENVVFTSGATEAANALAGADRSSHAPIYFCGDDHPPRGAYLYLASEHPAVAQAVLHSADDFTMLRPLRVDGLGQIRVGELEEAISYAQKVRVSDAARFMAFVQLANNETGVVQPIRAIADKIHAAGGVLIVDAVQGPGKIPVDIKALGADALFLSAHKFGGPKGVGAIVFAHPTTRLARAFIGGGGQERGQRGGTENLPGIAGMGAAARVVRAAHEAPETMIQLRDEFESRLNLLAGDVHVVGKPAARLANTTCFAIPGLAAEKALIAFDLDGVAVSSGSACSSGKVKASHVLAAMGQHDWVKAGAIRVSIGPATEWNELERCLSSLERQLARRSKASAA